MIPRMQYAAARGCDGVELVSGGRAGFGVFVCGGGEGRGCAPVQTASVHGLLLHAFDNASRITPPPSPILSSNAA